ncbi:hypothetical protein V1288_006530 [Bradyrhizobium sp. AZCC 2176]
MIHRVRIDVGGPGLGQLLGVGVPLTLIARTDEVIE